VLEAVKVWPGKVGACARLARRPTLTAPARDDVSEPRVGTKKRALRSNKETERTKICRSGELLDKKSPIQGFYRTSVWSVARQAYARANRCSVSSAFSSYLGSQKMALVGTYGRTSAAAHSPKIKERGRCTPTGEGSAVSRSSSLKSAGLARFDFRGGLFRMGFEHYMRDITAPPSASIGDREFCAPA